MWCCMITDTNTHGRSRRDRKPSSFFELDTGDFLNTSARVSTCKFAWSSGKLNTACSFR